MAGRGQAWLGKARPGKARQARLGLARRGTARHGKDRYGRQGMVKVIRMDDKYFLRSESWHLERKTKA